MKEIFILEVKARLATTVTPNQLELIDRILREELEGKEVYNTNFQVEQKEPEDRNFAQMFLSAKETEGCSVRTSKYYRSVLESFVEYCGQMDLRLADADYIRSYLAEYRGRRGCGNVTLDNIRRVLSSFYGWLESEDRIVKNPVRKIHKIKVPLEKKEPFSEEEIEDLRAVCSGSLRNTAILELCLSSGIRVGELVRLNRTDIDLQNRSGKVMGKGSKEREFYFDIKTMRAIKKYLESRTDDNPALFVSCRKYKKNGGYTRMSINAVETMIRKAGKKAGVAGAHPHRFRRTFATRALDKGMSIELVQVLLGHTKIDTTLRYAMVRQHNVRAAHEKYVC